MLQMLTISLFEKEYETKDQILAGVGDWHTFIQGVDRKYNINNETLEKEMDERVRELEQIDQRLADLYLRCKLKPRQSHLSY